MMHNWWSGAAADGVDAGSKDVLNGMFDLFQNTSDTPPVAKQPKLSRVSNTNSQPLVLPKANTTTKRKPNFFDKLFGNSGTRQKRTKHKTIFGF
jgi:hypothetical protein